MVRRGSFRAVAVLEARGGLNVDGGREMVSGNLSLVEIVERLQRIEALTAEGLPTAGAIRSAGVLQVEYDQWRIEYGGLLRTLGPLLCASTKLPKKKGLRRLPPSK
jgi:hypothetical protein